MLWGKKNLKTRLDLPRQPPFYLSITISKLMGIAYILLYMYSIKIIFSYFQPIKLIISSSSLCIPMKYIEMQ